MNGNRARRRAVCLSHVLLVSLGLGSALPAQERPTCPRTTARLLDDGWRLLRTDSASASASRFSAALSECPASADAMVGLGFAALRRGQVVQAESLFVDVTRRVPAYVDAWSGLATAKYRQGQVESAQAAWERILSIEPGNAEARAALERLDPEWERRRKPIIRRRAATLDVTMRVWGERFEMRQNGRWQPFYVKGVNLGPALPGRFPAEAPLDSSVYAQWLDQIGTMNANTLRVYTILPPAFYRALRAYNLQHPTRPLFLLHGVWTELPPRDDFADSAFTSAFTDEMRDVVDVLHGAALIAPRPGHANGRYDADVSRWTIGYIIGREWEPYSVSAFNARTGTPQSFAGAHFRISNAPATDVWMVARCDDLLSYEEATYNAQRPIAYTNWPTTDPMRHPTELTWREQARRLGIAVEVSEGDAFDHEEDVVSLDPMRVQRTTRNLAGWFASYHAYPYYPDFMLYDAGYGRAVSSRGPSNYFGYLQDLRRAHAGIPVLIAEFGVPSSRGNAHLQPQGWHHGGLSEVEQASMTVRLAQDIREAGMAGAVVFAWLDEWFKLSWISADFMRPRDRVPLWHNMLSPEQHFGLVAMRPGRPDPPTPGGPLSSWTALPPLRTNMDSTLVVRLGGDPGFVYLALQSPAWAGRPFDWSKHRLQIALDTHRPDRGGFTLPTSGIVAETGFEFLIELEGPSRGQVRVVPEYNPYTPHHLVQGGSLWGAHFRRPVWSPVRRDGVFDSLYVMTNAPRVLGDGRLIQAGGFNLGRLRYGRASEHSLVDWWYDEAAGMIQLRLPWGLLNVSDPSSRSVLSDSVGTRAFDRRRDPIRIEPTEGFHVAIVQTGPGARVDWTIPQRESSGVLPAAGMPFWSWAPWETPEWHQYLKPVYTSLQRLWEEPR